MIKFLKKVIKPLDIWCPICYYILVRRKEVRDVSKKSKSKKKKDSYKSIAIQAIIDLIIGILLLILDKLIG